MTIIGIIGPKAAGKDTIANYILARHPGGSHRFAEILDDILISLSLPITRENEVKLVHLRDVFGPNTLPKALAKKISAENNDLVLITGIRFQNELDFIRSYPSNKVIYVDSDLKNRYERQITRRQKADDMISYEKFIETERARTEVEIEPLKAQADFVVENNGSQEQLYEQVDRILQGIL